MSRDGLTIKSLIDKIREGDWHNPDLVGADLRGANLINANLNKADLSCVNFPNADLRWSSFREARLAGTNFSGATLRGADFRDADLYLTVFCNADLRAADLRGAKFRSTDIRDADLTGCHRNTSDDPLTGWKNVNGRLEKAEETKSQDSMKKNDKIKDQMSLIDKITGGTWKNPELMRADLSGANLWGADLGKADLGGADLSYSSLCGSDLRNADLREADLRDAVLCNVDLGEADLRGADLNGADLNGANLWRAYRNASDPEIPGWKNENGRLVVADSKETKKDIEMKLDPKSQTGTDNQTDLIAFKKECDQMRIYSGILPNAVEIAKTLLQLGIRLALKALGKTGEVVRSWLVIVDDFLASHAEVADKAFKWILGWAAKNLHQLRKLPGIKDLDFLAFLENPEIQKFGMYVEASTEGAFLGDLAKQAVQWIQQWIFGSATAIRIGDALSDPKQLVRVFAEMTVEAKEALRKEMEAEKEAIEAEKAEKKTPAKAFAMATA